MTVARRTIAVIFGACLWMTFDAIAGNPVSKELCLLAGFIGAWCIEGQK